MNDIIKLLEANGPLSGKEIIEKIPKDIFDIWRLCVQSDEIFQQTVGSRYLRLDKNVAGYARLSPSIIREFYNYTVISLKNQTEAAELKADLMLRGIIEASKNKFYLAKNIMENIISSQEAFEAINKNACFMISGDVAYEMAHLEPRPEFSTGKIVNGSDLDIVIVHKDLPDSIVKSIDSAIYARKFFYLSNPSYKEELDYVIKDLAKTVRQLGFEDFESMVASKVLDESKFLCGSHELYIEIKKLVQDFGVCDKLAALKEKASIEREDAIKQLLAFNDAIKDKDMKQLFYTTDEREEFF